MGKLQDFLMEQDVAAQAQVEVAIAPFPFPFVVKSITEAENKAIRKTCQKISFDKKTRQKQTETDTDLYNTRLVAACCVEPNFKDAALQEKYGVRGVQGPVQTFRSVDHGVQAGRHAVLDRELCVYSGHVITCLSCPSVSPSPLPFSPSLFEGQWKHK